MRIMRRIMLITTAIIFAGPPLIDTFGATNWRQVNGAWYYYSGETVQTGWVSDGNAKYYLGIDGIMKTGWQNIGGSWYLFRNDGSMHTGWWNENGVWYYLKIDGTMLADTTAPDGHWMNGDGSWNFGIVDPQAVRLSDSIRNYLKYIIDWETDSSDGLIGSGTCDMAIVNVLLGKCYISELNEKEKAVYDAVWEFIDSKIKDSDSDYDKVIKITKFIWENASYSIGYGGPYGLLVSGKGACDGYARTFKIIANAVGLECYYVGSGSHAWNIVKVDGEWYNADVTESESESNIEDAKYVLHSDAQYALSKYKIEKSPDCTAIKYTKSSIKTN